MAAGFFNAEAASKRSKHTTMVVTASGQKKRIQHEVSHNGETQLTMACADFVHSLGLPFRTCETAQFKRFVNLATCVPEDYKPPNRHLVSGKLLDLNYKERVGVLKHRLQSAAEIFGLAGYGDGATIKKIPLMNIMVSGAEEPCATLDIVDCSRHLAAGGKKDATYIANLFLPHLQELDPKKEIFDLMLFDGASNVQAAGDVLAVSILPCPLHPLVLVYNPC